MIKNDSIRRTALYTLLLALGILMMVPFFWMIFGAPFLEPSHVIFLGFMVLVGTPLLRIVASVAVFFVSKDWAFTVITGMVLSVLVLSMLLGVG